MDRDMQMCFLHTLFLECATETRGNKCKAVFYRYKRMGMRSLELFWPFSILAKNLGDILALSLSIRVTNLYVHVTERSLDILRGIKAMFLQCSQGKFHFFSLLTTLLLTICHEIRVAATHPAR